MDAEKIDGVLKGMTNFGGIFDDNQLESVKILSLPVMLIVNCNQHWISLYIDEKVLEVMDSIGLVKDEKVNPHLCRFLCAHMAGKDFVATPKLQRDGSEVCGKFAVSFLVYKSLTQKPLKKFLTVFSRDYSRNSRNISEIFQTILDLVIKLKGE